ncbi:FMN-dependent NADH-azoreductase [Olivibacter domesticus]|uniref:FMN dependent NADH:quinone oxidoreductase n=1 Tax=Olivibacter domesticus TaxID=407022 RepID=A0A1H7R7X1_OLID1|nr:NAD(P)H-dependent oxidoreductase [Olivibacter domesticus]SEL56055.1 FMN-dependent NADH-azoreductase [Olivibacter domesticus]
MSKVLVINASARKERSLSRYMTNVFVESWKEKKPNDSVIYREVGQDNIPHVTEKWIAGAFKPAELRTAEDIEALKISSKLVAELKDADVIVLGTPMYNWSVPSALKAYIDQVLRANETVLISKDNPENPYTGLLKNKKVYLLMVRGNYGYEPGEFYEHMDFQTNYLKTVFRIMGIEDIEHVALNGAGLGEEPSIAIAEKVRQLINN